jgi:dolichol-phosphate mannosyltransferase
MSNVTVIIPAYRVKSHILNVVNEIPSFVKHILVIDDGCPDLTGRFLEENCNNQRLQVIYHDRNLGVGAAIKSGYSRGMQLDSDILVKIDGDGQMDSAEIKDLIEPILRGDAGYAKGNRFVSLAYIRQMPKIRILGNIALTFISKASSGYWSLRDPNNGFTAIHINTLKKLNLNAIDNRYFFESDMLFNLYFEGTIIRDIPMHARYSNEKSNLSIVKSFFEFSYKHLRNLFIRLYWKYALQDFGLASFKLFAGITLLVMGTSLGIYHWVHGIVYSQQTNAGTVGIVGILVILGVNSLYLFLDSDVKSDPNLHKNLI